MTAIHDISVPVAAERTPIWPGDPPIEQSLVWRLGQGSDANVSRLSMSVHAGTHVDAPVHVLPDGAGVERLALASLVGACHVCAIETADGPVDDAVLEALGLPDNVERLLLKTPNSRLWAQGGAAFQPAFAALTPAAAHWLVRRGVKLVGIDYLSIEPFAVDEPVVHRTLLAAGVVVLEGIDLSRVAPGRYTLVCLPLNLPGSDGAPARAILIED